MNGLIKPSYMIIAILTVLVAFMSVAMIKYDKQVKVLQDTVESLQAAINDISEIKAVQLAIYPHIENKVTTTFGRSQNVTLQYYFTIDGNNLEIKPDSVYSLQKID